MDASVVYNVALALPVEERAKLYDMLKTEMYPIPSKKKSKMKAPEFSDEDALEYLIKKLNIN